MRLVRRLEAWQNGPIDAEEISVPIQGLHRDLQGFRMAALSDLHLQEAYPRGPELIEKLAGAGPDLICILGDIVDTRTPSLKPLIPLLEAMPRIAPTVAVLGNNDYRSALLIPLRAAYAAAGVLLLEDEARTFHRSQGAVRILGVQDPVGIAYGKHVERPSGTPGTQPLGEMTQDPIPTVLLVHQSQEALSYRHQNIALALGGHAHGGQFRFPLVGPIYAPGQGFRPQYTSGLYRLDGIDLVVSRGLGNHGVPIRLWNRPHLPMVTIQCG
ncbi:MAG TPA: metallophosphoesterase [Clostridia bacterium]|nr:metallophosphoesterase [Clostridia bacterium]